MCTIVAGYRLRQANAIGMQVETYNLPHVTAALHTALDHRTNGFY